MTSAPPLCHSVRDGGETVLHPSVPIPRLRSITYGPIASSDTSYGLAARPGLEPGTNPFKAGCSTVELSGKLFLNTRPRLRCV
jgi:hypothetical protein